MKTRRNWAVRTVRNGQVRIFGRDFAPSNEHRVYKGELEGIRFMFGLYYVYEHMLDFVYLWGTEESSKRLREDPDLWEKEEPCGPEVMEDNSIPWAFWHEVK